jgi:ABC-2 type transport system permease protein
VHICRICAKEWRIYFATPIGWVLLGMAGLCFALGGWAAATDRRWRSLTAAMGALTFFLPGSDLRQHSFVVMVALARVLTLALVPLVTMRLFTEERRTRAIEILLTSPLSLWDVVLGKWLGAVLLHLAILAVGLGAWVATLGWHDLEWPAILATWPVLILIGAALPAAGEWVASGLKTESSAAVATFLVCGVTLKTCGSGVLHPLDISLCATVLACGLYLTWMSLEKLRAAT